MMESKLSFIDPMTRKQVYLTKDQVNAINEILYTDNEVKTFYQAYKKRAERLLCHN